jgi:hypothetical protein
VSVTTTKPVIRHKGTAVKNIREYIDTQVGAGSYDRFAREFDPTWNGEVLRTKWYDMYTVLAAYRGAAEKMGITTREAIRRASAYCLAKDLGTVARAFLTVFDPEPKTILGLWPRMATGYIDFGRIQIVENVEGRFSFDFFAVPDPSPEFVAGVEGSMQGVLEGLVGECKHRATGYRLVEVKPDPTNPKHAMFRCEITYEKA